ncbi:MAG: tetratricopeptide repeat protein [Deltaproteobacteria bacterium]|nr:tetratricopeptide repeat protein [Deltaproteobacteria bacterium]
MGVRLAYLGDVRALPDFDTPAIDSAYHDYWAQGLASGAWGPPGGQIRAPSPEIERHPYFRPPGYPYFLGAVYALLGRNLLAVRIIQFVLGSVSCLLVAAIGSRLFGRAVGLLAGALAAVYWPFAFYEGELQSPWLAVLLELLAVLAALLARERASRAPAREGGRGGRRLWPPAAGSGWAFASGASLGLGALVVPNLLALGLVVALWLWASVRATDRRRARHGAAAVLAGLALAVAPATIRNRVVSGELVLISSNAGINLYAGNGPAGNGYDVNVPDFGTSFDYPALVRAVEDEVGRPMTHAEVSAHFAAQAWHHAAAHPGRTAALLARKAVLFWSGTEIFSDKELNFARAESPVLRALVLRFSFVLGAAVVGALLLFGALPSARRRVELRAARGPASLLVFLPGALFLSYLPFFVCARFRVPAVPFLLLLAAFALGEIGRLVRGRRFLPALGGAALLASVVVAAELEPYGVRPRAVYWHHLLAVTHARKGEIEPALARFAQALADKPDHVPSLNERGRLLLRAGRPAEAIADLQEVLRLEPGHVPARLDLGQALSALGRDDEAVAVCRAGLALRPDELRLLNNICAKLAFSPRPEDALAPCGDALRLDPGFVPAHVNLGVALARLGRLGEAEQRFRDALRIDPGSAAAQANLARLLAMTGTQAPP